MDLLLREFSEEVSECTGLSEELVYMVLRCYWTSVCNAIRSNDFERIVIGGLWMLRTNMKMLMTRHIRSRTEENKSLYWRKLCNRMYNLDEAKLIAKRDYILNIIKQNSAKQNKRYGKRE